MWSDAGMAGSRWCSCGAALVALFMPPSFQGGYPASNYGKAEDGSADVAGHGVMWRFCEGAKQERETENVDAAERETCMGLRGVRGLRERQEGERHQFCAEFKERAGFCRREWRVGVKD